MYQFGLWGYNMLFNSFDFLYFFFIVFCTYWLICRTSKSQNILLLLANALFYAFFDWRFLFLLLISIIVSYYSGINLNKGGRRRICWYWISIIINVGILGVFKYFNFFADSMCTLLRNIGLQVTNVSLYLMLPVGISFYTFQALNYVFDIYKRRIQPSADFIVVFNYISFFPLISSGPIERARNIIPQLEKTRFFKYEDAVDGCKSILWGLFKKLVIADNCAVAVAQIFDNYNSLDSITLIYGMLLYTIQIYCDFSGYSNIAIGVAKLLGINVMNNFSMPYLSRNVAEFWRKWHISLTTWFTEYIYIPLDGSRCSKFNQFRNTMIVFTVSGLWHGANWTFVCWGVYHGLLFLPHIFGKSIKYKDIIAENNILPSIGEFIRVVSTILLVAIGWVVFRSSDINMAYDYIYRMFTQWSFSWPVYGKSYIFLVLLLFVTEWVTRKYSDTYKVYISNKAIRLSCYLLIAYLIVTASGRTSSFIYFQF